MVEYFWDKPATVNLIEQEVLHYLSLMILSNQIGSLIFLVFPVPTLIQSIVGKRYDIIPLINYYSVTLMMLGWVVYGETTGNFSVLFNSLLGTLFFFVYGAIASILMKKYKDLVTLIVIMILMTVILKTLPVNLMSTIVSLVQTLSALTGLDAVVYK